MAILRTNGERPCVLPCSVQSNPACFLYDARIKNLLYALCVAAGICYGSMFSLVLALTGDLFGAEHIGTNYGLLDLGTYMVVDVSWENCLV